MDSRDETISNAVAEGNECQRYERRDGIANILPVDVAYLAYHQAANLLHGISITEVADSVHSTHQN